MSEFNLYTSRKKQTNYKTLHLIGGFTLYTIGALLCTRCMTPCMHPGQLAIAFCAQQGPLSKKNKKTKKEEKQII